MIDEPVTVIFSKNGWVRARQGWGVDPATLSFKEGDALAALIQCRTVDPVVFLDSKGRAYTRRGARSCRPARGDGAPASSLVDVQEGAQDHVLRRRQAGDQRAGRVDGRLRLPRPSSRDMMSNRSAGREFMSVEEGETPIAPFVFEEAPGNLLVAVSSGGKTARVRSRRGADTWRTAAGSS